MQVVVFKLNEEQFAVETSKVQSINDFMEVTKVPKAPKFIKGLINLRGNVISLLDINLLLDIEEYEETQSNIIILEMEQELVGIAVDQVDEVQEVDVKNLEKIDYGKGKSYVKGVINLKDRIVTLIDIDKLIAS
jgi:purine-binding chemotaxis protein CheW